MTATALAPLLPRLSEADPPLRAEGTIDPLGLYAVADSLGVQMVPGVRERQSHPRYLTAMAVGEVVCQEFAPDDVAADGVSPSWQVFEWFMVEGLVREQDQGPEIFGLPGRDKAAHAISDQVPLCARTYLKVPTVFGFHGVYRLLARTLDVINNVSGLGETGYRLLMAWEREQGLEGFVHGDGPGAQWRETLTQAVREGMKAGGTCKRKHWQGWRFFLDYLHPNRFGEQERQVLMEALTQEGAPLRRELIGFLVSSEGQAVWKGSENERRFHEALYATAGTDLCAMLDAIFRYEAFARYLQDAFDDTLQLLSARQTKMPLAELAALPIMAQAAKAVPDLYTQVLDHLHAFGESLRFEQQFSAFAERLTPEDWANQLLEHHRKTQAAKPPNGKASWVERFDDGGVIVRPAYRRDSGGRHNDDYVQRYRIQSLWSFLKDMAMVAP